MRKFLSFVLAVLMIASSVSIFTAFAAGTYTMQGTTIEVGGTGTVALKFESTTGSTGVEAFPRITASDESLTPDKITIDVTNGDVWADSNFSWQYNKVTIYTTDGQDNTTSGVICNFNFTVADDCVPGDYTFSLTDYIEEKAFKAYDSTFASIAGPADVTITVAAATTTYEVKFMNGDEQVGDTQTIEEGKYATAPATNPTKEADDEYTYTFLGWSVDGTEDGIKDVAEYAITAATTFTAVYGATAIEVVDPYAGVEAYAEERYPDATEIYYLSYANGDDSNDGLTPETAKKNLSAAASTVSGQAAGDYVVVLLDEYVMGANFGGNQINLSTAPEATTLTLTGAKDSKVRIATTISAVNGAKAKIIFDEIKVILGDNAKYATNAYQSWVSIDGEININAMGTNFTVTEDFEIAEMSYSAAKKLVVGGSEDNYVAKKEASDGTVTYYIEQDCDPVQRTAGIGFHATVESGDNVSCGTGPAKVLGGAWGYVRATGSGAKNVTSDIVSEVGGNAVVTYYALGGHGSNTYSIGNITGTISCGTVKAAYTGGKANGSVTGNTYLNITGGTVENLYFGNDNTTKYISGDSIVTVTGGTIGAITDKGNVSGNTVLFLNNGYTTSASIPSAIDYVIKAPAEGGTVTIALNEDGSFAGFKATPATESHVVKINGLDATADANGVYAASASTEITFGEPVTGHIVLFNDYTGEKLASFEIEDGATFDKTNIPTLDTTSIIARVEAGMVKYTGWDENLAKLDSAITDDVTITATTTVEAWPVISAGKGVGNFVDNNEKKLKADATGFNNNSHTTGSKGTVNEISFKGYDNVQQFIPGVNRFAGNQYYPVSAYTLDATTNKYTLNDGAQMNTAADKYDAVNGKWTTGALNVEGYGSIPNNMSFTDTESNKADFRYYDNIYVKYYFEADEVPSVFTDASTDNDPQFVVLGGFRNADQTITYNNWVNYHFATNSTVGINQWKYAEFAIDESKFNASTDTIISGITNQYHLQKFLYNIDTMYANGEKFYIADIVMSPDPINIYTVTFKGDTDYVVEVLEGEEAVFAGEITIPAGKTIAGWSLTENGEALASLAVEEDTTLYPVYGDIPTKVVYVSASGNDSNDGLTKDTAKLTMKGAIALAEDDAKTVILVVDDTSNTADNFGGMTTRNVGDLTITSKWGDEDYTETAKMPLPKGYWNSTADQSQVSGKITFQDICIYVTNDEQWSFLNINGFDFCFDEGVVVESSNASKYNIKFRTGGEQGDVDYDGFSGPLVFESGVFGAAHLASKGESLVDNVNIIWNTTDSKASLNVGNDSGRANAVDSSNAAYNVATYYTAVGSETYSEAKSSSDETIKAAVTAAQNAAKEAAAQGATNLTSRWNTTRNLAIYEDKVVVTLRGKLTGYTRLEINAPVTGISMNDIEINDADYAVIFNDGVTPVTPAVVANDAKKVFKIHAGEGFILHNTEEVGVFEVEAYPSAAYLFLNGEAWTPATEITLTESGVYTLTSADYKVEFKQGETVLETDYINVGELASYDGETPVDGTKTFTGWAVDGTDTVVDLAAYTVAADTVFVPVFVDKYVVKFMNGETQVGETIEFLPSASDEERTITAPAAPADTDTTFFKIWKAGEVEVAAGADYTVTGSITFEAVFVDAIVVTFTGVENGTYTFNPLAAEADRTVTAPDALADTDTTFFKNWIAGDVEVEAGETYVATESITFGANYVDGVVVKFYNGETLFTTLYANPLLETMTVTAPDAVDYTGEGIKVFTGWATQDGANQVGAGATATITAATDFYAQFADKFIVKFMNGDVQVGEIIEIDPTAENKIITTPAAVDYAGAEVKYFANWAIDENNFVNAGVEYEVTSSVIFTANFVDAITVKFFNGETQVGDTQYFNPNNTNNTATTPAAVESTEAHKIFAGWTAGETTLGANATFDVTESIIFVATYDDEPTYTVTFMVDGEAYASDKLYVNDAVVFPETEPVKDNHTFDGWYVSTDDTKEIVTEYTMTAANVEFVASFTENPKVSVTIGGEEAEELYVGAVITLPETAEIPEGMARFLGWATTENATAAEYAAGSEYTIGSENVQLYAVYSANKAWYSGKATHTVYSNKYELKLYIQGDKIHAAAFGIGYDNNVLNLADVTYGDKFALFTNTNDDGENVTYQVKEDGFVGGVYYVKNVLASYVDTTSEPALAVTLTFNIVDEEAFAQYDNWTEIISTPNNATFAAMDHGFYAEGNYLYCPFDEEDGTGIVNEPIALESCETEVVTKVITVAGNYIANDRAVEGSVVTSAQEDIHNATLTVYSGNVQVGEAVEIMESADSKTTAYTVDLAPGAYTFVFTKPGYLKTSLKVTVDAELDNGATQTIDDVTALAGDVYDSIEQKQDGVVNLLDFLRVMRGFDATFSANAANMREIDLDENGEITVDDLDIIKAHFRYKAD